MSKVKEFAARLGVSVGQLAAITGYSRQGLHYMLENRPKSATRKLRFAVKEIKLLIEKEYQRDAQALEARHIERLAAAEELLGITKEGEP